MNYDAGCSTMDSSEMPPQDPTMTHQLFQLITEMSADEKRTLLKILKGGAFGGLLRKRGNKTGGNSGVGGSTMDSSEMPLQDPTMTHQLFQLITEMSADEKRISLKILKGGSLKSRCRRQHLRKPVHMRVRYAGKDGISSGVIRDLSLGGMFILSRKAFSLGQGIQVAISHANLGSVVWMAGDVVRVTPEGIGLRFKSTTQIQKTAVLTIGSVQ